MDRDIAVAQSIMNQPLGPLRQSQARIAELEAKVAQADFYIIQALENAQDYDDLRTKVRTAHATLKEAMKGECELVRFA
jgi:hypothetical protein